MSRRKLTHQPRVRLELPPERAHQGLVARVALEASQVGVVPEERIVGHAVVRGLPQPLDRVRRAARPHSGVGARDGELRVVREFSIGEPKSKLMRQTLNALEIARTVLVVDNAENRNLELSSRNLEGVKLVASRDVNVYDLLGHQQVLLTEAAAKKLSEGLQ